MAKYRYVGPGPQVASVEIVHPGDVRDFDEEPDWGPWELIEPDASETPATPPATQTPAAGASSPGAASTATTAATSGPVVSTATTATPKEA